MYPKISLEGLIKPGYNQYLLYFKMLVNNFSIYCNIIEVGGGIISIFTKYISCEQLKTGFGTITVYSQLLSSNNCEYSNMLLYKELVTSKTDLSKFDLVIDYLLGSSSFNNSIIYNKRKHGFNHVFILCIYYIFLYN